MGAGQAPSMTCSCISNHLHGPCWMSLKSMTGQVATQLSHIDCTAALPGVPTLLGANVPAPPHCPCLATITIHQATPHNLVAEFCIQHVTSQPALALCSQVQFCEYRHTADCKLIACPLQGTARSLQTETLVTSCDRVQACTTLSKSPEGRRNCSQLATCRACITLMALRQVSVWNANMCRCAAECMVGIRVCRSGDGGCSTCMQLVASFTLAAIVRSCRAGHDRISACLDLLATCVLAKRSPLRCSCCKATPAGGGGQGLCMAPAGVGGHGGRSSSSRHQLPVRQSRRSNAA
jgi:hypothetical protein